MLSSLSFPEGKQRDLVAVRRCSESFGPLQDGERFTDDEFLCGVASAQLLNALLEASPAYFGFDCHGLVFSGCLQVLSSATVHRDFGISGVACFTKPPCELSNPDAVYDSALTG